MTACKSHEYEHLSRFGGPVLTAEQLAAELAPATAHDHWITTQDGHATERVTHAHAHDSWHEHAAHMDYRGPLFTDAQAAVVQAQVDAGAFDHTPDESGVPVLDQDKR